MPIFQPDFAKRIGRFRRPKLGDGAIVAHDNDRFASFDAVEQLGQVALQVCTGDGSHAVIVAADQLRTKREK